MFNWLKRKKSILDNWNFEDVSGFEIIQNPDSIQYVSNDGNRVIYFSVLHVSGGNIVSIESLSKPSILENAIGWQLKGAKKSNNQILTCVISVSKQNDIDWAKAFFDSIVAR